MKKHNATWRLLALLVFAALGLCVGLPSAFSQDDEDQFIKLEVLQPLSRPAALFAHDEHNEKAGLDDCAACHHGKDDQGKKDPDAYDVSEPCAECHKPAGEAAKGTTPLMRAYHQQCISCHKQENKGPTHCAGCHQKD